MLAEVGQRLGEGGLLLDPGKTQWSHNLAVSFASVTAELETVKALKRSIKAERDTVRNALKRHYGDMSKAKQNMRERLALPDDSGEAWLANFFDTNEIDWARAQAKPLRERIALLDR